MSNQLNQVLINDNGNQTTRSISRDLNGGTTADSVLFTTANEPSSGVTFARSGALANLPTYYDLQVDERANHLFQRVVDARRVQAVSGGGYVYTNQSQTYDLEGRLQDQQELSPYAYLRQFVARQELIQIILCALVFMVVLNNLYSQEATRLLSFALIGLAVMGSLWCPVRMSTLRSPKSGFRTHPSKLTERGLKWCIGILRRPLDL